MKRSSARNIRPQKFTSPLEGKRRASLSSSRLSVFGRRFAESFDNLGQIILHAHRAPPPRKLELRMALCAPTQPTAKQTSADSIRFDSPKAICPPPISGSPGPSSCDLSFTLSLARSQICESTYLQVVAVGSSLLAPPKKPSKRSPELRDSCCERLIGASNHDFCAILDLISD